VFKRREEALKLKDLELQESLIRFSKFLQENDSKRARAEKKAADEIKARLQKEKEIEKLTEVLEELRNEKERIHVVQEENMRCACQSPMRVGLLDRSTYLLSLFQVPALLGKRP